MSGGRNSVRAHPHTTSTRTVTSSADTAQSGAGIVSGRRNRERPHPCTVTLKGYPCGLTRLMQGESELNSNARVMPKFKFNPALGFSEITLWIACVSQLYAYVMALWFELKRNRTGTNLSII